MNSARLLRKMRMMTDKEEAVRKILKDFYQTLEKCEILEPIVRWSQINIAYATAYARCQAVIHGSLGGNVQHEAQQKPIIITVREEDPLSSPVELSDVLSEVVSGDVEISNETHEYDDKREIKRRLERRSAIARLTKPLDADWFDDEVAYKLRAWITGMKNKKMSQGNETEKLINSDDRGPGYAGGGR